jgi:alkylation response protein AidB-like acyl-CoA dehydrogenase
MSSHGTETAPAPPSPGGPPPHRSAAGALPRLDHDEIVARAEALVADVRARAQEGEDLRRLPDATMADVEASDLLRAMVPRRWGGHGLGLRTVCELTRVLAQGCASTAWVVGFLVEHNWQLARFPAEVQEEIFGAQPVVRAPAQLQPAGTLEPVAGGYRLSGRWEFCSGVMHSEWTILAAMATGRQPGDRPAARILIAPLDDVAVEDVWHTSGMRATGSNAIVARDLFVPEHRVASFRDFVSEDNAGVALHDEPVIGYPLVPSLTVFAASVAIGSAERVVELFGEQLTQRILFGTTGDTPGHRPKSQARLADATVRLRTAQLLWRDALDLICDVNDRGGRLTPLEQAQARLQAGRAVLAARDAISTVCDGAGAHTYFRDSPIQRYQRDIETMKGHAVFDVDRTEVLYGRLALGLEPVDRF